MALAVSAGLCKAGRTRTVATGFGLAPVVDGAVICAWAEAPEAININVAVSIDLMTSLRSLKSAQLKHICLVGHNRRVQQMVAERLSSRAKRGSKPRGGSAIHSWLASRSLSSGGALAPSGWLAMTARKDMTASC